MGRLALIGKAQTLGEPVRAARVERLGPIGVLDLGTHVALYRHGLDAYVAPHRIDHAAHLRALTELGCDRVLAFSSVGSLRPGIPVGSFVAPDDFIALDQPPVSGFDDERQHIVPAFTPRWRNRIVDTWRRVTDAPIVDRAVYWQANGPRFETPAEIRLVATFAELVGMTVPSECVAANQLGVDYAAVCVVDNLANGVDATPLTTDEYERGAAANAARLAAVCERLIPELAE